MSISMDQIKWGRYQQYEGPYHHGLKKFVLSSNASDNEKIVYVITQTEGSTYDAVNLYDSCVCSVGLIQFCDRFHLVSRLLGAVADALGVEAVIKPLERALKLSRAIFKQNNNKQWRFFIDGVECNTPKLQQKLYLGGSSGLIDAWTGEQKNIAFTWAYSLMRVWEDPRACEIQLDFTAKRLMSFVLPDARREIFDDDDMTGWKGALKAAFLSYAANNPRRAADNALAALKICKHKKWSPRWCIHLIKQMTFGPKIAIYGGRYNKIRPALEKIYGVTLPKTDVDLLAWDVELVDPEPPPTHDDINTDLRQVDKHETPTLPSLEPPPTIISNHPERELVSIEEANTRLPPPPKVPIELRKTIPVDGNQLFAFLVNLIKQLFMIKK